VAEVVAAQLGGLCSSVVDYIILLLIIILALFLLIFQQQVADIDSVL